MQVATESMTTDSADEADALRQAALDHIWFQSAAAWDDVSAPGGVNVMVEGKGCYITDIDGNTYFDGAAGLWLAEVGYGRQEIADAMAAQAAKLHYTRSSDPAEVTIKLASKLAELTPGTLSKCFFTSGGSESNETALKMAIQYHRLNGEKDRYKLIGRKLSYHGGTFGTMSVGGSKHIDKSFFEPLLPGARNIAGPYHHVCEFCRQSSECNLTCAYELERTILAEGPETVAAFIGEPVSNSSGVSVPHPEYWPIVRSICDKYGVLLICDEVITGFGRTGKMFGVEHWGIVPDIMTVAKGLTSGYSPMGAAIAKTEIFERFKPGAKQAFQHVVTFGGHPVSSAAALTNLAIIERERLVENAAAMGSYLMDGLRTLSHHPSVGDVRGLGLLCMVDLTRDKTTMAKFSDEERSLLKKSLTRKFRDAGVFLVNGDKITLIPPLIIQKHEVEMLVDVIDRSLSEVEEEQTWWIS